MVFRFWVSTAGSLSQRDRVGVRAYTHQADTSEGHRIIARRVYPTRYAREHPRRSGPRPANQGTVALAVHSAFSVAGRAAVPPALAQHAALDPRRADGGGHHRLRG